MRDTHSKTEVCKWFRDGHCRFPELECWNKYETRQSLQTSIAGDMKCHTCKKGYTSKDDMMRHRLQDHRDKVKLCRYTGRCSRQNCWYRRDTQSRERTPTTEEETPKEWVESEIDSENADFPEATNPPAPPTKETKNKWKTQSNQNNFVFKIK